MKTVYTVVGILVSFLILWIFSLNVGQTVDIDLAFRSYKAVNLITITYISFFMGFVLGLLILVVKYIGFKREKFQLQKENKRMRKELVELQSTTPQNDISIPDDVKDNPDYSNDPKELL